VTDEPLEPAGTVQSPGEDWVYLVGRPPAGEFLGYVKLQTVGGDTADVGTLMNVWRAANAHIQELVLAEAGAANNAEIGNLPDAMAPLVENVAGDPIVGNTFNAVPMSLGMVELDKLVVFQKHINLRYVEELKAQLGPTPSDEDVFRFALPYDHPVPPVVTARTAQNQWLLTSPSADFRFLSGELVNAQQLVGVPLNGVPAGVMAVIIGHGSNFLNAIAAEGRLVLNNGSHRAYALRDLGITHAPCLIQNVTTRDELELLSDEVFKNADRYLSDPRPPMLKDYFDPQLRQVLPSQRLSTQVRVSFGIDVLRVPR